MAQPTQQTFLVEAGCFNFRITEPVLFQPTPFGRNRCGDRVEETTTPELDRQVAIDLFAKRSRRFFLQEFDPRQLGLDVAAIIDRRRSGRRDTAPAFDQVREAANADRTSSLRSGTNKRTCRTRAAW